MIRKIAPLVFIFICTTIAWFILGGITDMRTTTQDDKLEKAVSQMWGSLQRQEAPTLKHYELYGRKTTKVVDGTEIVETVQDTIEFPINIEKSDINVSLNLDHRKKGLLWYSTYGVVFQGIYLARNIEKIPYDADFQYNFPSEEGIYENFVFKVDNNIIDNIQPKSGTIIYSLHFEPGQEHSIEIGYKSQGMDEWWYAFGPGVSKIDGFKLTMNTDFDDIDFPENSISPTEKEKTESGWRLTWEYSSLISGIQIGMDLPQRLNPGPLASRLSFFAPVSLFIFLFLMFIITAVKRINIHPMNYFFIAAAFFSFHLLLSYLIDHIDIHLAFIICAIVSIFLVISYMRLVVGTRFALIETGLSQFIYLVLFSYTFFLEGYTGLAITICSIITLFIVMMFTGRIDWNKQFKMFKDTEEKPIGH